MSQQCLPLQYASRARHDLQWSRAESGPTGEPNWVAKDPISLKYYRLRDDERFVLSRLDGERSINEIRDHYNARYTPRRVNSTQIQQLVTHFFREGLVIAAGSNQSRVLNTRRTELLKNRLRQQVMVWLFYRFPGVHADKVATKLQAFLQPVLHQATLVALLFLASLSALWLLVHWERFQSDIWGLERWSSVHGVVLLGAVIGFCKTLHELGHAVACKMYGGECHEIGVMLMFGIPCLYCDTSDAWLVPNRYHRILISSGGIIVELILGTIAIWVWNVTQPGLLHWLSVDVILVCFAGSILFNANPLLRYDGYYILSDLLGVSNLQSEASTRWTRFKRRILYGPQPIVAPERSVKMQLLMLVYHAASYLYRTLLLLGLAWIVLVSMRTAGYESLGWQFIALGGILMLLATGIPKFIQGWKQFRFNRFHPRRVERSLRSSMIRGIGLATLGVFVFYPSQKYVTSIGELRPSDLTPVLSSVGGTLVTWKEYGASVASGDVLVQLESSRTKLDALEIEGKWNKQRLFLDGVRKLQIGSSDVAAKAPAAETLLKTLAIQKWEAEQLVEQLSIRTMKPGTWIEPTRTPPLKEDSQTLGSWDVIPLEASNSECWIEPGTLLGWVANLDDWEVQVLVEQSEIEWLRVGQEARVFVSALPSQSLVAEVTTISTLPASELAPRQSNWPGVINDGRKVATGSGGQPAESAPGVPPGIRPMNVSYWVTLRMNSKSMEQLIEVKPSVASRRGHFIGSEVTTKFHVGRESLFQWGWRWVSSQLKF